MLIKTSDLEGAALDWAVAKAVGLDVTYGRWGTLHYGAIIPQPVDIFPDQTVPFKPSADWSQGGPLIERYEATIIGSSFRKDGEWGRNLIACVGKNRTRSGEPVRATAYQERGEGHLVAFMRAIVAAELGDEVDVPDELAEKANG